VKTVSDKVVMHSLVYLYPWKERLLTFVI